MKRRDNIQIPNHQAGSSVADCKFVGWKKTSPGSLVGKCAANPGELLSWDTKFFGFRIGRAHTNRLTARSASSLLVWANASQLRCLYLSADSACAKTLNIAHSTGFKFVDVRLEFAVSLEHAKPLSKPGGFRAATTADIPSLIHTAREAHTDTRFFNDAGFPRKRAAELYAEWIRRDFTQHHIFTIATADDNKPTNYITCHVDAASRTGHIGLLAVSKLAQGRGIGRRLLNGALSWFQSQSCCQVHVVTQGSNLAAQRLYQTGGFRTVEIKTTYHRWF